MNYFPILQEYISAKKKQGVGTTGVNKGSAPYQFRMLFSAGEKHLRTHWEGKEKNGSFQAIEELILSKS